MYKEVRYFNGKEIVRVVQGENEVKLILDKEDRIQIYMENGLTRIIKSSYIELAERYESSDNNKTFYSVEELSDMIG